MLSIHSLPYNAKFKMETTSFRQFLQKCYIRHLVFWIFVVWAAIIMLQHKKYKDVEQLEVTSKNALLQLKFKT